jgi:hypothetical protein
MANEFGFLELEHLKNQLAAIRQTHLSTLNYYVSGSNTGYWHAPDDRSHASLSSTATCVSSLVGARLWNDEGSLLVGHTADVAAELITKNTSAGLDDNNPFSLSFVAEGVLDLIKAVPDYANSTDHHRKILDETIPILITHLMNETPQKEGDKPRRGSISIPPYPPSAYLTQLVFRVLDRCDKATQEIREAVYIWSRAEINKQVALISADSRVGDPLQLVYALILTESAAPTNVKSPEDLEIFRHALKLFFHKQKTDGSWPASRPLFHYSKVGNAYCFEYELLTQLLLCREIWDEVLPYLRYLAQATQYLRGTAFDLRPEEPGTVVGWASGHHPQLEGPESWSTASVYHFAHTLDRLLGEALRRALFSEVGAIYPRAPLPSTVPPADDDASGFAPGFLDAPVYMSDGPKGSLRQVLAQRFVYPIAREAEKIQNGGRLSGETPMSAILFGPPGTSKTELAKIISSYLKWPLLSVDPSYLVKEGVDKIQTMANKLFGAMAMAEQIVVLLDEFDEIGRSRSGNEDMVSRFITTAMLPKLAAINRARKIVFLLATNYVSGFDAAFSRGGRFDMLLQVMPPTLDEKLTNANWSILKDSLKQLQPQRRPEAKAKITDLTFLETQQLVRDLNGVNGADNILSTIVSAWEAWTLERHYDTGQDKDTGTQWRDVCQREAEHMGRIPPLRKVA